MVWFFLSAFLVVACGGPSQKVTAPKLIGDSFVVQGDGVASPIRLKIQKHSLEKEFLLQGNLIDQTTVATGHAIRSRIVAFSQKNGQLYLLEATQGHVVTQELPSQLLLAQFPVVSEDESSITFDFNAGMSAIFTSGDWFAEDSSGNRYDPGFENARINLSYLQSAQAVSSDRLVIRQIAQAEMPGFFGGRTLPIEVRYFLEPYRPAAGFEAAPASDFKLTGFFEVSPRWSKEGRTYIRSVKHNIQNPITFAISANTPNEYREAVRQGILYWNQSFNSSMIQVVDAPMGITAPDVNYNIIQWVPHDGASSAYADIQMDPRTGQVLHAQAYITSSFALSGIQKARAMLRRLKTDSKVTGKHLFLKGFEMGQLCDFEPGESLIASLTDVLAENPGPEQLLRLSQDFIRAVVAHEVGHLMGLRHNFAGSLYTKKYSYLEKEAIFKDYLEKGSLDSKVVVSGSVMDYPRFEEEVLMGHAIGHNHPAMEHDVKAISVLYFGKKYAHSEIPPFCTDSQISFFIDCDKFDVGSSVVESSLLATEGNLRRLPNSLLERFVAAKTPQDDGDLEAVSLDPEKIASTAFTLRTNLISTFTKHNHLLAIYRTFKDSGPLSEEAMKDAELGYFLDQIEQLGGMSRFFAVVKPDFYDLALSRFGELARSSAYKTGASASGKNYSFSESDIKTMENRVQLLMKNLPKAVAKADLEMLKSIPSEWKANDNRLGEAIATVLGDRMDNYLLSVSPEFIEAEIDIPEAEKPKPTDEKKIEDAEPFFKRVTAKLPKFFYAMEERKAAAVLLNPPDRPESIGWAFGERKALEEKFTTKVNEACGCDILKLDTDKIKVVDGKKRNVVARWFIESKKILDEIK